MIKVPIISTLTLTFESATNDIDQLYEAGEVPIVTDGQNAHLSQCAALHIVSA